ncbi:MAG: ThuA domain-containing protein [Bryobacteraceae bacterium]
MRLLVAAFVLVSIATAQPQPRRVLFVSHSAGFRHDSIPVARAALQRVGARAGIEVTATEDLSFIRRDALRQFDALFFFTSGELPLDNAQKADLLDFVRQGKGFGGAHSATDTLYSWPEYGDLIGAYFDGHPWTHVARIEIEDPAHPSTRGLPVSFTLLEEFYQHRQFSRDRVRVLMTLDTRSVDLRDPAVHRTDEDFALAWCRDFGAGRVFYTALGHFDQTWQDPRVQIMLEGALRYLTNLEPADCSPRGGLSAPIPRIHPLPDIAPGGVYELFGEQLTPGATMVADPVLWASRSAGVSIRIGGSVAPVFFASPSQINFQAPWTLRIGDDVPVAISIGNRELAAVLSTVHESLPRILAVTADAAVWTLWCTGLGAVTPSVPLGAPALTSVLSRTAAEVTVLVDGQPVPVLFAGAAPAAIGLYQVNVATPDLSSGSHAIVLRIAGESTHVSVTLHERPTVYGQPTLSINPIIE